MFIAVSLRTTERTAGKEAGGRFETYGKRTRVAAVASPDIKRFQSLPESSESFAPLGPTISGGFFLQSQHWNRIDVSVTLLNEQHSNQLSVSDGNDARSMPFGT